MKKILLVPDAAAGLPPVAVTQSLTCDPLAIATDIKAHIGALEKDAAALTPLLGFALTSLRGALSALEGHVKNSPPPAAPATETAPPPAEDKSAAPPAE